MTDEIIVTIVGGIVVVILMVIGVIYAIKGLKRCKKQREAMIESDDDSSLVPEPEIVTIHAKVTDLQCEVKVYGTKAPEVKKEFRVYFEDDGKDTYEFIVPEEMYACFEKGQTGTLTLSDGNLYGFELDEKN